MRRELIIVNGVPKSGTTLLQTYLVHCGVSLEPGGLMCYNGSTKLVMRGGKPWGSVRSLQEVLADYTNDKIISGHFADFVDFPVGHKIAYIFRNPRDILISTARWRAIGLDWTKCKEQPTYDKVRRNIKTQDVMAVINNCRAFRGWLRKAHVIVSFEELVVSPEVTGRRICTQLGLPFYKNPRDILGDKTPWVTPTYRGTWSGQLSDWRMFWDSGVDKLWLRYGGDELENSYGYTQQWSQFA